MKRIKRILAFMLTLIILLTLCDWSVFTSLAAGTNVIEGYSRGDTIDLGKSDDSIVKIASYWSTNNFEDNIPELDNSNNFPTDNGSVKDMIKYLAVTTNVDTTVSHVTINNLWKYLGYCLNIFKDDSELSEVTPAEGLLLDSNAISDGKKIHDSFADGSAVGLWCVRIGGNNDKDVKGLVSCYYLKNGTNRGNFVYICIGLDNDDSDSSAGFNIYASKYLGVLDTYYDKSIIPNQDTYVGNFSDRAQYSITEVFNGVATLENFASCPDYINDRSTLVYNKNGTEYKADYDNESSAPTLDFTVIYQPTVLRCLYEIHDNKSVDLTLQVKDQVNQSVILPESELDFNNSTGSASAYAYAPLGYSVLNPLQADFPNNEDNYNGEKIGLSDDNCSYNGNNALNTITIKLADIYLTELRKDTSKDSVTVSTGLYQEIVKLLEIVFKARFKQYGEVLNNIDIANDFNSKGNEIDASSIESILAHYTYARLAKEQGQNVLGTNLVKVDQCAAIKFSLKDSSSGKKYVLVTDTSLNSEVSNLGRLTGNSVLSQNYEFYTARTLMAKLSSSNPMFVKMLVAEYYSERERLNIKVTPCTVFANREKWTKDTVSDTVGLYLYGSKKDGATPVQGGAIANAISEEIKSCNEDNVNASTILEYISYTYENGLYLTYNGLFGEGTSTDSSEWNVYNAGLNKLKDLSFKEIEDCTYIADTLPVRIGAFGNDGYQWFGNESQDISNSQWYRFVSFLHNTAMGFEIANGLSTTTFSKGTKFKDDDVTIWGYSVDHIKELLEQWNNPDPDKEDFNGDIKTTPEMIQAILGLHDFMDALDIDQNDWTPTIAGYYGLYDKLKKYANNPLIKRDVVAATVPTVEEPMAPFFSIQDNSMTDYWTIGFSLSATYVPFETNMYDASSVVFTSDTKWISDFYYKYGFYRKALMINTDASAITNEELTGKKSGTRVATLKDLVYPAGDVILTIDDDFYNAEKVQESVDRVDYTTIRGTTPQATGEDEADKNIIQNAADKLGSAIEGSLDLDAETILKTDGQAYYSSTLATNCTHLEASEGLDIAAYFADAYLLDKESIFDALDDDEYSAKQSFAVVSAIYRSADLYNLVLKSLGNSNELFKASKGVANIASCDEDSYMYYMNYLMLEGLERQMKNTSSNQLDLNAPIFCDIFGNIVTESGDIIIPASANTTLAGENWSPVNIGFATLVGGKFFEVGNASEDFKEWITGATFDDKGRITKEASTKYTDHTKGAGWFTLATDGFCLMPCMVSDGANQMILNWSAIPVNGDNLKNLVYNVAYNTVSKDSYNSTVINLVIETLRGAPIENIDYAKEGLSTGTDMSRFGVYAAFKLEDILNSVYSDETTNNSMLNYKNLVFVSGIEYIVLYVYKVMFAIMIVSLFIHIYADATKNQIGFKSAISFVSTIACVIFCVTLIPQLISWSYYNANKSLLSNDMGYLVLLNYVKELDGKEINVASLDKPSTTTETYIKLEDIKFDWFEATSDVLFKNTFKTVSEIYENEIKGSALANAAGVVREGDCLYYPISEMLDNADIAYNTNTKTLSLRTYSDSSAASYISPFYVILRQLVSNVNAFNMDNNVVAMSVETSGGDEAGQILTYDLSTQYLISDLFVAEGYDITGMHKILQDESDKLSYAVTPFSSSDIERCSQSFWYPEDMPNEKRKEIVNDLEDYARAWVGKNADIFGKVPDEALLKVFALQLAIKFNQLVGCPYGDAIEIINLDSRDLFRLMISTKDNTYKYFSYGLARYTYETGNVIGCICMIAFVLLDKVVGSAKTIAMIIIIGLLITNVIFRKLLFRKNSQCFEGYLITCGGIIAVNYLYSLSLAIQMQLAGWGLATWMCIFFGIFVQIAYVACLIGLVFITMKDWQNNGYEIYTEIGSNVMVNINNMRSTMQESILRRRNSAYAQSGKKYEAPNRNGNDMLDDMFRRDSKRARAAQGPDEAPGNSSSKYVVVSKESLEESLEDYDRF